MKSRCWISAVVVLLAAAALLSCATTSTFWIPVYQISGGGYQPRMSFDPHEGEIVNPVEGACLAYYSGEDASSVVFSNRLSLSLANKVVLKNNEVDAAQSTGTVVSNLSIWKTFYYDPALTSTKETQGLFILKDGLLAALDHDRLRDGQVVEYLIAGQNTGTDSLREVVVLDVLPRGFEVASSEYWFRKNETAAFEHKIVTSAGRQSLVLVGKFVEPLAIGDSFQIKIRIRLDLGALNREFD